MSSPWLSYKEQVRAISQRIVKAQAPIRILHAISWDDDVAAPVIKSGLKKLPKITHDYYQEKRPIAFDAHAKVEEFEAIKRDVAKTIGEEDDIGRMLVRNCGEYQKVVRMLQARGTGDFHKYASELYGSPKGKFIDDKTTIRELGILLYEILGGLGSQKLGPPYEKSITSEQMVEDLNARFERYFHDHDVHVKLDDGIVSDAAAGSSYLKVRRGLKFSERERDLLEVHEGWVHIATSLSGAHQRLGGWLAKGPPCCTIIQEGLAVLMEIITFSMTLERARKINNRILACDKAEDGADFREICEFYRLEGYDEAECFQNAYRVFRGGMVKGGAPFTKDIVYAKGFIMIYNFLRTAIRFGRPDVIPFLFVGKITLDDVPALFRKHREEVIDAPLYLPPQFRDLNGLAVWMAYSNFLNRVELGSVQRHYQTLLAG